MMRSLAAASLIGAAVAEPMITGGTLKVTWSDCGSQHGKATSITPSQITLGQTTKFVGLGAVTEAVPAGGYEFNVKAGFIPLLDYKGDLCRAESVDLPGGVGTLQWQGLKCPVVSGPVEIDLSITLSASIPASLAKTSIKITGTGSNGDNLLCIQLNTEPEEEVEVAGACTADDLAKISKLPLDTSTASFGAKCNDCGHKAYHVLSGKFDHQDFNTCMAQEVAISSACSECYAAAGDYGAANCKLKCISAWCKSDCLQCTASAQQTAVTCSGRPNPPVTPCLSTDVVV